MKKDEKWHLCLFFAFLWDIYEILYVCNTRKTVHVLVNSTDLENEKK